MAPTIDIATAIGESEQDVHQALNTLNDGGSFSEYYIEGTGLFTLRLR